MEQSQEPIQRDLFAGQKVPLRPRQLDQPPAAQPEVPATPPRSPEFECPSCFTLLKVPAGSDYGGEAAPCPACGARIVPPRLVEPGPAASAPTVAASATIGRDQRKFRPSPPPPGNPAAAPNAVPAPAHPGHG